MRYDWNAVLKMLEKDCGEDVKAVLGIVEMDELRGVQLMDKNNKLFRVFEEEDRIYVIWDIGFEGDILFRILRYLQVNE